MSDIGIGEYLASALRENAALRAELAELKAHHDECFNVWTETEATKNDEIERLRAALEAWGEYLASTLKENADLRAENERLRAALSEARAVALEEAANVIPWVKDGPEVEYIAVIRNLKGGAG